MANTFRVTSISSVPITIDANTATIYTCPSGTTTVVLALLISNKHTVAVGALEIMAGQKYVLQVGDSIKVYGDNTNLDVVLSYMEMT